MLNISLNRLLLVIVLQFAAVNAVYAFVEKKLGADVDSVSFTELEVKTSSYQAAYELSQNGKAKLRSRSDVIQEVKRKYNAEVLKISLDERQQVYRVRVLMPNGKVRNLRINARR